MASEMTRTYDPDFKEARYRSPHVAGYFSVQFRERKNGDRYVLLGSFAAAGAGAAADVRAIRIDEMAVTKAWIERGELPERE